MVAQEEFKDPMKYIASIEAEAGKFGETIFEDPMICKVPPQSLDAVHSVVLLASQLASQTAAIKKWILASGYEHGFQD